MEGMGLGHCQGMVQHSLLDMLPLHLLEGNTSPLLGDFVESRFQIVGPQNSRFTLARCHNQNVVHRWATVCCCSTAGTTNTTRGTSTSCCCCGRNEWEMGFGILVRHLSTQTVYALALQATI